MTEQKTGLKQRDKRIVSFVNQKGGVGKTSSALCIATGLALAGQQVLLIDGDPQGNLTLFFTEKKQNDLYRLFIDIKTNGEVYNPFEYPIRGVREKLDLIPIFERELRSLLNEKEMEGLILPFSNFLAKLKQQYDWIFIFDCSPSNGMLEKAIISVSEAIFVPLEFQLFSIAGLNGLLDEISRCGEKQGRAIIVEALIFTKAEKHINRIKEYRQIFSDFHIPIYEICKSEDIPKSIEMKRTIWEIAPSRNAASDYYEIITHSFLGS